MMFNGLKNASVALLIKNISKRGGGLNSIQTKVAAGRSDVFWMKCTKRVRLAKNG